MTRLFTAISIATIIAFTPLFSHAADSDVISDGNTVTIDYTLTVENKVIATTENRDPVEYVQGNLNTLLPALQQRLSGKKAGDELTINLGSDQAYGAVDPNALVQVPKSQFPNSEIKIGSIATTKDKNGHPIRAIVKDIRDDVVVLDFNHPLAGKDLTFDIKIIKIS